MPDADAGIVTGLLIYAATVPIAWAVLTAVVLRNLARNADALSAAVTLIAAALFWPLTAPIVAWALTRPGDDDA